MNQSDPLPYWSLSTEQAYDRAESSAQGLSDESAAQRLLKIGPNSLAAKAKTGPLRIFLGQFKSPIVLILLFATVVSMFVQEWVDAVIILAIVIGSATLSFYQEYNASQAVQKLKAQVSHKAAVLRNGVKTTIPVEEIVPGDVVLLSAGSLIPADGFLIEAQDFFVNQAVLTGETFPVEKKVGTAASNAEPGGTNQLRFHGHQRELRDRQGPDHRDRTEHRLRANRRLAQPAPSRNRI